MLGDGENENDKEGLENGKPGTSRGDPSKGLRDKSLHERWREGGVIHHADTCLQVMDGWTAAQTQ